MDELQRTIKGRGAAGNPPVRFEKLHLEEMEAGDEDAPRGPRTEVFADRTRTIIARNDSPDIPFSASLNPYRGCEHGCIYCYARPTHEYLGLSAGVDFESRIFAKVDAPKTLKAELSSRSWKPEAISISGVTDCYQPVERRLRITRGCIEVLREFGNPFTVITKNHLVTRDLDLFSEMAAKRATGVFITVTTLDPELAAVLEPRASRPAFRLQAVRELSAAGVPTGVMISPVIPGLTDHEIPTILKEARAAGARFSGFVPLRLPGAVSGLFEDWLSRHFPDRKEKVLGRVREMRGGRLNDPNFNSRMRGFGPYVEQLRAMFKLHAKREGLNDEDLELSTASFKVPSNQLELF
jgi:DNA repair photolyase